MKRPRAWNLYGTHTPGSLLNARADPVQIRQVVEATTISVGARCTTAFLAPGYRPPDV